MWSVWDTVSFLFSIAGAVFGSLGLWRFDRTSDASVVLVVVGFSMLMAGLVIGMFFGSHGD